MSEQGQRSLNRVYHVRIERLPKKRIRPLGDARLGFRSEELWILLRIDTADGHTAERIPFNQYSDCVLHHLLPNTFQSLCHNHIISCLLLAGKWHLRDYGLVYDRCACESGDNFGLM